MLHIHTDASYDSPILSAGYVITRNEGPDETLVEAGYRVMNTDELRNGIDWCSSRAEYRAMITGVRAALDHTDEPVVVYTDNEPVKNAITGHDPFEEYFSHALLSFLNRFTDWHVTSLDRRFNERAHEQARVGLKLARDLMSQFE